MNRDLQVATRGYPIIPSLGKPGKKVRIRKGWRRSTEHNMKQQRTCQLFYAFLVLLVFTSIDIDSSRFPVFQSHRSHRLCLHAGAIYCCCVRASLLGHLVSAPKDRGCSDVPVEIHVAAKWISGTGALDRLGRSGSLGDHKNRQTSPDVGEAESTMSTRQSTGSPRHPKSPKVAILMLLSRCYSISRSFQMFPKSENPKIPRRCVGRCDWSHFDQSRLWPCAQPPLQLHLRPGH